MLYKTEIGLYKGQRVTNYYTELSRPTDLDHQYYQSKQKRPTDFLELREYDRLSKKWSHVFSMMNF